MDSLTEAQLSHEIYLNKLSSFYANKFPEIEGEIISALRLAFSEFDDVYTKQNAKALNDRIEELLEPILENYITEQEKAIEELAEQEAQFQQDILTAAGIAGFTAGLIQSIAETAKKRYRIDLVVVGRDGAAANIKKNVSEFTKNTIEEIKGIVLGGYTYGVPIDELRKQVTGTAANRYQDGYVNQIKRNQTAIIKTARKHMEMAAKVASFNLTNSDGYVLTAVLDSRTSDICLGWNGTVVLWTSNNQPLPPFHYNCRTTIVPYYDDRTEVPEGGFDWLKKQSAKFQDDLIGPTRGAILRNSGLTSEEYRKASRNNLNEPITLEEMARKNEEIRDYLISKNIDI